MDSVALNFFPLKTDQFTISLYRLPYLEGARPIIGDEQAVRRNLPINGERENYWTSFEPMEGSTKTICGPFDNIYATIDALRFALLVKCQDTLEPKQFNSAKGYQRRLEITVATHPEGSQVVSLEPYLLRSKGQFGFLTDFRFHPNEDHRGTRRAHQLSLSLDRYGQPNRNYYADRYSQLLKFVKEFHPRLFPLKLSDGHEVEISPHLAKLSPETLDIKHYVVGSGSDSKSQFMGVKQSGPLSLVPTETHLCFLYRPEDRPLSHDLFRALRGDTFRTFPGMERMFRFSLKNDRVSGIPISDFSTKEIGRITDRVVTESNSSKVIPIVLTPFSRHDDLQDNDQYWLLKHTFLSRKLPLQVVATETVADKNKLKWSTAGIALQVFAKAGGTPWKVRPRTESCLIVGIGQAHQITANRISRYFAYSVLTNSSGVFEEVRTLGEDRDEERYMHAFSENLRSIFHEYSDRFCNFVVHATFTIQRRELKAIARILSDHHMGRTGGEFVSLKFNERNRFFGFASGHNSRVPFESTIVSLARNEFLVWFEGLQYGQSTVRGRIGRPLHVEFIYPSEGMTPEQQRRHLQDAINLSGANWRGFNAKSLPISVYYAQIIADYLKQFDRHGLPAVNVNTLTPWFL